MFLLSLMLLPARAGSFASVGFSTASMYLYWGAQATPALMPVHHVVATLTDFF